MKKIRYYLIFLALGSLAACNSGGECPNQVEVSKVDLEISITRLEQEFFKLSSRADIRGFLKQHPVFAKEFLQIDRMPNDSILIEQLYSLRHEPHQDTLYKVVQKEYPDVDALQAELEEALKHVKYYFPDFEPPKRMYTFMGAFLDRDLFISSELLVINLDVFLGEASPYRPRVEVIPEYIWRRYHRGSIVPTLMLYLSNNFNQTKFEDKSLLAEMIYYGKAYHFVKRMQPCVADSLVFGYTQKELANIADEENRQYIWNHFIEKELLFSTRDLDKNAYLGERPYVAEINKNCPGRIARWLGYRIIQKYLRKNPELEFQEMMQNPNAREIFNRSVYQGD